MKRLSILFAVFAFISAIFGNMVFAAQATITVTALPPTDLDEGAGKNLIFVLRRTGNISALTVRYKMTGTATSGQDYTAPSGSAHFVQGAETVNVPIAPLDDPTAEIDETVTLNILSVLPSSPTAEVYQVGTPSTASATIKDNEPFVTLSTLNDFSSEVSGTIVLNTGFRATRTGPTGSILPIDFRVSGTATSGTDYVAINSPVNIPQNASSVDIRLGVIDDLVVDPDETVSIALLTTSQRYKGSGPKTVTVTIRDNDPPQISLASSDATAEEANLNTATIKVVRNGDVQQPLDVHYNVNPANTPVLGTAATSGSDFVALSGSITLPANKTFANLVITPLDDSVIEGTEEVLIRLTSSAIYTLGTNISETISILDNDLPFVSITTQDGIASETGPDAGSFTFSRSGSTAAALMIKFSIATSGVNPATRDVDYSLPVRIVNDSVTISAGQNSVDVAITPIDDAVQEQQEQVVMSIVADAAYVIGNNNTATIFIADND